MILVRRNSRLLESPLRTVSSAPQPCRDNIREVVLELVSRRAFPYCLACVWCRMHNGLCSWRCTRQLCGLLREAREETPTQASIHPATTKPLKPGAQANASVSGRLKAGIPSFWHRAWLRGFYLFQRPFSSVRFRRGHLPRLGNPAAQAKDRSSFPHVLSGG